jgi:hypothetical protein
LEKFNFVGRHLNRLFPLDMAFLSEPLYPSRSIFK